MNLNSTSSEFDIGKEDSFAIVQAYEAMVNRYFKKYLDQALTKIKNLRVLIRALSGQPGKPRKCEGKTWKP